MNKGVGYIFANDWRVRGAFLSNKSMTATAGTSFVWCHQWLLRMVGCRGLLGWKQNDCEAIALRVPLLAQQSMGMAKQLAVFTC